METNDLKEQFWDAIDDCECDNNAHETLINTFTALEQRVAQYEEALKEARENLGKVIVYPWQSEEEIEAHIIPALVRIDDALKGGGE